MAATPIYALPYPVPTDPADVPADMQRLANRAEAAIQPGTVDGQTMVWDNTLKVWKPAAAGGGSELAYAERTTNLAVGATTEAGADIIVTCPAITLDGATKIVAEFFASQVNTP